MMQILAMHGWAGQASAWAHWCQGFEAGGSLWASANRGYGGEGPVQPARKPSPNRKVLIAHSMGLHLLPAAVLEQADAVVLLGTSAPSCPTGAQARGGGALKGMQAALGTDEELMMLERFLDKAASPHARSALPPAPCCRV